MENRTICVWGDSIAKGVYFDEARERYAILKESCLKLMEREAGFLVRNYAVMGRTAAECLAAFDEEDAVRGAFAVFEFGGNDSDMDWAAVAREPDREHPARSSVAEYKEALCRLTLLARERGMEPVIAVPLPLDGERYFAWVSRGLDGDAILRYLGGDPHMMYRWQEQYAAAARDAAREAGARVLDLRGAMLSDRRFREYYSPDGIHLNGAGHRKMYRWLMETLPFDPEESGLRSLAG